MLEENGWIHFGLFIVPFLGQIGNWYQGHGSQEQTGLFEHDR